MHYCYIASWTSTIFPCIAMQHETSSMVKIRLVPMTSAVNYHIASYLLCMILHSKTMFYSYSNQPVKDNITHTHYCRYFGNFGHSPYLYPPIFCANCFTKIFSLLPPFIIWYVVQCTINFTPCHDCFMKVYVSLSIVKCLQIHEACCKAFASIWSGYPIKLSQ